MVYLNLDMLHCFFFQSEPSSKASTSNILTIEYLAFNRIFLVALKSLAKSWLYRVDLNLFEPTTM